jgi:hypothetical protein
MVSANILDIHFTAGNRSELDRKFRAIVAAEKTADETMSDFIKRTIVYWYEFGKENQNEASAVERVRQELMGEIRELRDMIDQGIVVQPKLINGEPTKKENEQKITKLSTSW